MGIAQKGSSDSKMIRGYWSKEEEIEGKNERMRANDGAVDSQGRFWTSAVCDPLVVPMTAQGEIETTRCHQQFMDGRDD